MAWNEPGGGKKDDPWGGGGRGGDQGPPDLDEALRKLQNQLSRVFGGGGGGGGAAAGGGGFSSRAIAVVVGVALAAYFLLGFYTLDEQERGVVFRFGAVQEQVAMPGLRWRPLGIDEVTPVNVTRVFSEGHSALMLTEDQNIVDVSLTVQYIVANPIDYAVNVRQPQVSLQQATESALRHVVGGSTMDDVIGEGREVMAGGVQERLQSYLDSYGSGMSVRSVNLDRGAPPSQVESAFDDVQRAREDEVRFVNEANAYAEQIIPEARGDAQRIIEQANAYRAQVIARAEGESSRFTQLLVEYQAATDVTRNRLYIDAIESVLENSSKIFMDVEGGNNMLYLPLDQLRRGGGSANAMPRSNGGNQDAIRDLADAVLREIESRPTSARRPR
ncbi:MAG: FtsH protease activity modulator HflK [Gammaproteobacteria bacterium]|nr:FtsH protease activity modulator HflK [Gammaproteobacteria bacterium]